MTASVSTHSRAGQQLPSLSPPTPVYSSNVYEDELQGVDEMINEIVTANMYE
jgi:hypothetical protein